MRSQRRELYPLLAGVIVGMVIVGLVIPQLAGEAPVSTTATDDPTAAATGGPATRTEGSEATASGPPSVVATPTADVARRTEPRRASSEAAAAEGQSGPAAATFLTATDVGVTERTIKVGFILLDLGGASDVGLNFGIDPRQQEAAIRAAVDELNDRGGIHGRAIEPTFARNDVAESFTGRGDSARAACLKLTEEDKVFAVVGYFLPADQLCVVREHQVPMLSDAANVLDATFEDGQGRLITVYPRASRIMADWTVKLDQARFVDGLKIGLVVDENLDPNLATAQSLKDDLERAGHPVVRTTRLSGQLSQAASQMPVEVSEQRRAGAEAILFLANPLYVQQSIQQAESQRWFPKYSFSDFANGTADPAGDSAESMDGALGVTGAHPGAGTKETGGFNEPAAAARCRDVYEARSGRKLAGRGTSNEYSITMIACDDVQLFAAAATLAGSALTRQSFVDAVAQVGRVDELARIPGGSWGPGKPDLADFTRLAVFASSCSCWQPRGPFQPMEE